MDWKEYARSIWKATVKYAQLGKWDQTTRTWSNQFTILSDCIFSLDFYRCRQYFSANEKYVNNKKHFIFQMQTIVHSSRYRVICVCVLVGFFTLFLYFNRRTFLYSFPMFAFVLHICYLFLVIFNDSMGAATEKKESGEWTKRQLPPWTRVHE